MINVRKQNKPSYECMMNAETALALCKRSTENEFKEYHCSTGLVFLAFAVEAMFIFYRRQVDPTYDKNNDKTCRKDFHKKTLKMCGIDDLMGLNDYQIIRKCLRLRDEIAHGDFFESSFDYVPEDLDVHDKQVIDIISKSSKQFRDVTLKILEQGIEAAKNIDDYICDNGYKADEKIEREYLPKLQPAFGVTGISVW